MNSSEIQTSVNHSVEITFSDFISNKEKIENVAKQSKINDGKFNQGHTVMWEDKYSFQITFASNADAVYSGFLKEKENKYQRGGCRFAFCLRANIIPHRHTRFL